MKRPFVASYGRLVSQHAVIDLSVCGEVPAIAVQGVVKVFTLCTQ